VLDGLVDPEARVLLALLGSMREPRSRGFHAQAFEPLELGAGVANGRANGIVDCFLIVSHDQK